ncbi:MAG: hypothetical protein ACREV4_02395 [Gammaproteobacteria bacterium]
MTFLDRNKPEDLTVEERVKYGRFPQVWNLHDLAELIGLKEQSQRDFFPDLYDACERGELRYTTKTRVSGGNGAIFVISIYDYYYTVSWTDFVAFFPEAKKWKPDQSETSNDKKVDARRADAARKGYEAGHINPDMTRDQIHTKLRDLYPQFFSITKSTFDRWWDNPEYRPFSIPRGRRPGR